MTRKKLLMLLGSVCLALMLAVPLVVSCAGPAPSPTPSPSPLPSPPPSPSPTLAPSPAEEVFEWRFQSIVPLGGMWQADHFAENLNRMSNGRLVIETFAYGELLPTEEAHIAVQKGVLEMTRSCGAYCSEMVDIANIEFGLPRAWDNPLDLWTLFIRLGLLDMVREAYAEQDLYYLGVKAEPPYALISAKPISNLEELRKLKLRAYGITATYLESVGARTVYIPVSEVYTAFATGTIDACVYGGATDYLDLSMGEVAKYYVYEPYVLNPNTNNYLINMDAWNSLPDDLKAIFEIAAWEQTLWCSTRSNLEEYTGIEEMGLEGVYWPAEDIKEFTEAAVPFWEEEAAKSPRCAKAVQIVRDWMEMSSK